jgi:hypothetical protein
MPNPGTSTDWWTTTKAPRNLFRPAYQTEELDDFLRANRGIDSAILAAELGMSANQIKAYQRQLGLRRITGNADYPAKKINRGAHSGAPSPRPT